jgi:hypothetical protein
VAVIGLSILPLLLFTETTSPLFTTINHLRMFFIILCSMGKIWNFSLT